MIDWPKALAEHDRWLRTALFARLGQQQAVDDVMQEVSLAAAALRAPLADPSRAGAWLYRVAIRQALLYRRRTGRQKKLLDNYTRRRGDYSGAAPDPLSLLLMEERRSIIREALLSLPACDAEILLLKYTENWNGRELAQHLGVSESCVEARLYRARQRLRTAMVHADAIEVLK